MIRLLHFANYPNQHGGSFIPLLRQILKEARERGWTTDTVFTSGVENGEWVPELRGDGVGVEFVEPAGRRAQSRRVESILAASELPTVIHTHFTTYDVPAALAARRRGDSALFWHIHTVLRNDPLSRARNAAKFALFGRDVDGIFVPAANIGEGLARRMAPREKLILLPSPIDPDAYRMPSAGERAAARREFEIPEGSYALLHIGRAWRLKGGDVFFEAVRRLREAGLPVIGMTLRGGEPATEEARRLGITEQVRVLERVEIMNHLYAASDCFVAPSRGEGMPFSVVEALASGVPVVASDHLPGHVYLSDQVAACETVPGEPEPIADAVARMLARPPEQAEREAREAREWIEGNLDLTHAAESLVDAYAAAALRHGLISE